MVLFKKLYNEVCLIYESMLGDLILTIENSKRKSDMQSLFKRANEVFKNKMPYVIWFFEENFRRFSYEYEYKDISSANGLINSYNSYLFYGKP